MKDMATPCYNHGDNHQELGYNPYNYWPIYHELVNVGSGAYDRRIYIYINPEMDDLWVRPVPFKHRTS
jgi:hypothetical protein